MSWGFEQGEKILFLPDQHLGRNTAVLSLGLSLNDCVLWNPWKPRGGLTDDQIRNSKVILWRGHCSVHGRFSLANIDEVRERVPGVKVLVHPECTPDVVALGDYVGSTSGIIDYATASDKDVFIICTEMGVLYELKQKNPGKTFYSVGHRQFCPNMKRISLENVRDTLRDMKNQVELPEELRLNAKKALDEMLRIAQ